MAVGIDIQDGDGARALINGFDYSGYALGHDCGWERAVEVDEVVVAIAVEVCRVRSEDRGAFLTKPGEIGSGDSGQLGRDLESVDRGEREAEHRANGAAFAAADVESPRSGPDLDLAQQPSQFATA